MKPRVALSFIQTISSHLGLQRLCLKENLICATVIRICGVLFCNWCINDVSKVLYLYIWCAFLIGAEADGALDKARKHKKRQLEDTLNLVLKKRKVTWIFYAFMDNVKKIVSSFCQAVLNVGSYYCQSYEYDLAVSAPQSCIRLRVQMICASSC